MNHTIEFDSQFHNISNEYVRDLFIPRYLCLNDFPGNMSFEEGGVYQENKSLGYLLNEGTNGWNDSFSFRFNPERYPVNFKKLEWWEHRKIQEMPIYLRYNGLAFLNLRGKVIKPYKIVHSSYMQVYVTEQNWIGNNGSTSSLHIKFFNPASKEEFDEQNKCNNSKLKDLEIFEKEITNLLNQYKSKK